MTNLIKVIWSLCFLCGAVNHARDIWIGGWLPYEFMPMPFNIYWTALLPLDLIAASCIWFSPRFGAMLGVVIMVSDVAINSWTVFGAGYRELLSGLVLQTVFCLFVLITFRRVAGGPIIEKVRP